MIRYVVRKIIYGFLVVLGVTIGVFFIFHALPGDPTYMITSGRVDPTATRLIRDELGLDKPLIAQLGFYLNDLSPISVHENTPKNKRKYEYLTVFQTGKYVFVLKRPYMRRSFQTQKRVDETIMESLPGTLWLALASMSFATVFGIFFGVISALNPHSRLDNLLVPISVIGISAPSFVAAMMVSMFFGHYLHEYTGLPLTGSLWEDDATTGKRLIQIRNIILPAFTLGIRPLSIIMQLTRSAMIDVISQDYIRTARAKGLPEFWVITKHALKNALNPVITAISGWLATLMTGAFFIEHVFKWKGLGFVTLKAVTELNFPLVMGTTIFIAIVFVVINFVVDIIYTLVDPRVRLQ
jgi:ABC-type dipeptide/oligopeptide/nickel transport system permease component